MKNKKLTKTDFMSFLQCKEKFRRDRSGELKAKDVGQQFFTELGNEVGDVARLLFPNGILVGSAKGSSQEEAVAETHRLLIGQQNRILFEASFATDKLFNRADILEIKEDDSLAIYEVKAKTSVTGEHLFDIAFQKFVIEKATGMKVSEVVIILLNEDYTLIDKLDVGNLFKKVPLTKHLEADWSIYTNTILSFINSSDAISFDYKIGRHCNNPNPCPYQKDCFPKEGEILDLRRSSKKWDWFNQGMSYFKDLSDDSDLTNFQKKQIQSQKEQRPVIDVKKIKMEMRNLEGVIAYMDFESISLPIPRWEGIKAYQHVVFQASLHIQWLNNLPPGHFEFLHREQTDPSLHLVNFLIRHLSDVDHIVVYYEAFEKGRLRELQRMYPDYKDELQSIINKIFDLEKIFSSGAYVDHRFKGSTSIKKVLGVVCSEFQNSYEDLELVKNGQMASYEYFKFLTNRISASDLKKSFKALSKYCMLDTLSLWHVHNELKKLR